MKKFFKKIHISNYIIYITLIFVIGFFLRIIKFHFHSVLEADEGRDLLVARHIVKFGEFVSLGHLASGLNGFYYGPYYYYLLAFFTFIYDSPYFIFAIMTVWHSISIIFLFYIGKNLFSSKVGILTSLLYSLSFFFISTNNIWGAYVSLQIFILSFFFFSLYSKNRSPWYLFIHIVLLSLSVSIQYGNFLIVPIFIVWNFILDKKGKKSWTLPLKIIICYIAPIIIMFIPQILYFHLRLLNLMNIHNIFNINKASFFIQFYKIALDLFEVIFQKNTLYIVFYICFILTPLSVLKWIKGRFLISPGKILIFALPLLVVIVVFFKTTVTYPHEILPVYIFLLIGISLIIDYLSINNFLLILLTLPILFSLLPSYNYFSYNLSSLREIEIVSNTIGKILLQNKLIDKKDIDIFQNSGVNNPLFYPAPEVYLFLEKNLNQKFINIIQETEFNYTSSNNAKYLFLICRSNSDNFSLCLDNFLIEKKYIYEFKKTIYDSSSMKGYSFIKINKNDYSKQLMIKF